MSKLGVHSEVGKLHTVMVCRPGLAHQRLTPGNCKDLLFDDVLWVHEAQKDHYDFVLKMQERGVEVLDLHDMLARDAGEQGSAQVHSRSTRHGNGVGAVTVEGHSAVARRDAGEETGGPSDRWDRDLAICRRAKSAGMLIEAFGGRRLRAAADSEHAVSARSVVLDLRRRDGQSDVLAGAQTRDAAAARGLQVPSAVRRREDLVG